MELNPSYTRARHVRFEFCAIVLIAGLIDDMRTQHNRKTYVTPDSARHGGVVETKLQAHEARADSVSVETWSNPLRGMP